MLRYILKRLVLFVPVFIGVSLLIFFIMSHTPGDPVIMVLGEGYSQEEYDAKREEMGLDEPFFERYFKYIAGALHGDFGKSYRNNQLVFDEIKARLPYTLQLAVSGTLLAICIGIPAGIISAIKRYTATDNILTIASLILTSMPGFWLAMMMILLFSVRLSWLPAMGVDNWKCYIMPAIATGSSTMAALQRMTRTTMLEVIRQDYIRTARAKGDAELVVIVKHALRNALLPVVTVVGVNFGHALGGSVVIEGVFAIPGLGQLMVNSIKGLDTPMVMGAVIFAALIATVVNLIVDIAYTYIDPRVRGQLITGGIGQKGVRRNG